MDSDSVEGGSHPQQRSRIEMAVFWAICFAIILYLNGLFGSYGTATLHNPDNPTYQSWTSYYGIPTFYEQKRETTGGKSAESRRILPLNAAVAAAVCAVIAWIFTRSALAIRQGHSILRPLAIFIGWLALVAFILGGLVSKWYWGYWYVPPPIDERALTAKQALGRGSFGGVGPAFFEPPTEPPDYYIEQLNQNAAPSEYPYVYTDQQLAQAGIGLQEFGKPPVTQEQISRFVRDPKVKQSSQKGYDTYSRLSGTWIELQGKDNQRYLYLLARTGEVRNDHYPFFRLLFKLSPNQPPEMVSHQVFYYEVSGVEGADGIVLFLIFLTMGFLCSTFGMIPFAILYLSIHSARRKKRLEQRSPTT